MDKSKLKPGRTPAGYQGQDFKYPWIADLLAQK
jgi:hypothetical protein